MSVISQSPAGENKLQKPLTREKTASLELCTRRGGGTHTKYGPDRGGANAFSPFTPESHEQLRKHFFPL